MSHNEPDPAASTDKFRAFVDDEETAPARPAAGRGPARIIVPVAIAIVLVAVIAWLLL